MTTKEPVPSSFIFILWMPPNSLLWRFIFLLSSILITKLGT